MKASLTISQNHLLLRSPIQNGCTIQATFDLLCNYGQTLFFFCFVAMIMHMQLLSLFSGIHRGPELYQALVPF